MRDEVGSRFKNIYIYYEIYIRCIKRKEKVRGRESEREKQRKETKRERKRPRLIDL